MSTPKKFQTIYVTLDSLLDTRLGTVARIDQSVAAALLEDDSDYLTRDTDVFFVDANKQQQYKTLYQNRDTDTLACSSVTECLNLVKHLAGVLAEQAIGGPFYEGVKIVVNTYPYQLTNEEQEEIGRVLATQMRGIAPVELTSISPKDLTPRHCKQSYAMMIAYDYEAWMEVHSQDFQNTRLPNVTLFGPAIYQNKPSAEELLNTAREAMHPFQALEMLATPIIDLKLIDVKYFSILSTK